MVQSNLIHGSKQVASAHIGQPGFTFDVDGGEEKDGMWKRAEVGC